MPEQEVRIDEGVVRQLLRDQHADLADLPVSVLANGWDNVMFRLGSDYTVRVPRRQMSAELVRFEQRWLPLLAPRLPLPIPAPVRVGIPTDYYPWYWSIQPYFEGATAAVAPPRDEKQAARQVGEFLAALHQPAPPEAPVNPFRGVPLVERDPAVRERLTTLGDLIDAAAVAVAWERALAAPVFGAAPLWLHGDMHSANILTNNGRISAIIDFGDITSGDPASDLAVAWMLFSSVVPRNVLRHYAGDVDDDTWARAWGWALNLSLAMMASSADNPLMMRIGRQCLAAVLSDPENIR